MQKLSQKAAVRDAASLWDSRVRKKVVSKRVMRSFLQQIETNTGTMFSYFSKALLQHLHRFNLQESFLSVV